ncbi:Meiosis inhibitor protein 1 [Varanus komodoensis]|nr:Meiosis inhibitor protein 1 [Varanus komodoensis]
MFVLLGKLADVIPKFADILMTEHSLLKQLLKYDNFVAVLMCNSGKGADSASLELYEGDSLLPLILKKLLLSRDELLQVQSAQCMAAVLVHSPTKYASAFIHADIPGIEPILRSLKEILTFNNVELHKQGFLLFTEILKRQPVEIKLFASIAVFKDAITILLEAVNSPILEVAAEAVNAVAAILRKDHVSFPPVQYGELQKLIEGVLKRCIDLPLPSFNRRLMGHRGSIHQNKAVSQQGQFLQSVLESFRNACRLAVEYQKDPLAQENAFTAPNSENKDTLKSFSEFLLRISDSLCIPLVMKYSEKAVRPGLMEVFISTLNILFSVKPDARKRFSIKLEQEISELLQRSLPQLNYNVLESISLLSETPGSFCLDETLRNHQYSLLLLFYFAFSQEDRFVPEVELFSAIRSFLLSVQNQGDCPPPYVFKTVLYLLAVCQDNSEALDLASLSAIRRILDIISDFSLVYVHHPLLLKFFLRYPELMGRFGHHILRLWFSCEDYSQIGSEDVTRDFASFSDGLNNFRSLLSLLKGNLNALLVLLKVLWAFIELVNFKASSAPVVGA